MDVPAAPRGPLRGRHRPPARVVAALRDAGFPDPDGDAAELAQAAGDDAGLLAALLGRRLTGEPLPWLTGRVRFAGLALHVRPGVYVPRAETEALAARAVALLPADGSGADLATGCGAVAATMARGRPGARVVATDADPVAVACARSNGVDARPGDLGAPVADLAGRLDVVTAVVPYVPTAALVYLPRDVRAHEPLLALDGGPDGLDLLRRAVAWAGRLLRPGGAALLELGAGQDRLLGDDLAGAALRVTDRLVDEDGDLRAIEAVREG